MLIGIISDAHEDIVRLEKTLKILKKKKVDKLIFLGDMVGFGVSSYSHFKTRDANKVADIMKKEFDVVLIGNHDLYAIGKLPTYRGNINFPNDYYSLDYFKRKKLTGGQVYLYEANQLSPMLTDKNEKYLDSLKEYEIRDYGDYKILFSHYNYPDFTASFVGKIKKSSELKEHFEFMKENDCLYSFSGHGHVSGIRIFTEKKSKKIKFNEKYVLPNELVWLNGPTIANGVHKNGFMIFNTETREIEAIPLKTKPHTKYGAFKN